MAQGIGCEVRSAKSEKKVKNVLDHLRVRPGEKGGVNVEHYVTSYEHPVEKHIFGQSEGPEALAHIAQHSGIEMAQEPESEGEEDKAV